MSIWLCVTDSRLFILTAEIIMFQFRTISNKHIIKLYEIYFFKCFFVETKMKCLFHFRVLLGLIKAESSCILIPAGCNHYSHLLTGLNSEQQKIQLCKFLKMCFSNMWSAIE